MTAANDDIGVQLFTFGLLILPGLCALSLFVRGNQVKWSDLTGVPIFIIPIVYCIVQIRSEFRLRHREGIATFLQRAHDFRMRKKRVDGFLPRRPGS